MTQTAVEWLFIELYERFEMKGDGRLMDEILEQAKLMEKKQIINAYISGEHQQGFENEAEQYYNETFGKE